MASHVDEMEADRPADRPTGPRNGNRNAKMCNQPSLNKANAHSSRMPKSIPNGKPHSRENHFFCIEPLNDEPR